jgi:exopolysaccharide biosynthesis WecB/TagA/CpsF family protein
MKMAYDGASRSRARINFLGLEFSGLDLDQAIDAVTARASIDCAFAYVVTPNVDHVVGLSSEPARRPLYESAWMTLNDSNILKRLGKRVGLSLPVATGADLAERLFDGVIDHREPVTIIGGDKAMIEELKRRYALTDVRWHRAPMGLKQKPEAIVKAAAFAAAQPSRFTFICVGAPQQELIAYAIAQRGDAMGVGLCVGAALGFLSGQTQRAPVWMRKAGLEWFYRLASEPGRLWKRYLVTGPKVFSLFAAWRASMAA